MKAAPLVHTLAGSTAARGLLGYNKGIPGPVLDFKSGDVLHAELDNAMDRPTTIHWHGMRAPNAMDGVPGLTQAAVEPGGRFSYRFGLSNPGTYWYHPHFQSAEQLDRGLSGVVLIRGDGEPEVDREVVWVLDDWRVDDSGQPEARFDLPHDFTHAGRIGNLVTVNGRRAEALEVRRNERIRLRLVNAANARIFNLDFSGHRARVIALDGHAVTPHVTDTARIVLGPSMRADLIIDFDAGAPGQRFPINDVAYRRDAYTLAEIVYSNRPALRSGVSTAPVALPSASLPEPDLAAATRHRLTLQGGAMGGMASASLRGQTLGIRELVAKGKAWSLNGVVAHAHEMDAMFRFPLGSSHVIEIRNDTAWPHPLHLHGHPLRVLGGVPGSAPLPHWRDSVLVAPGRTATVALVADNPGRWMLHCHIPEHQQAGMMGIVEVA